MNKVKQYFATCIFWVLWGVYTIRDALKGTKLGCFLGVHDWFLFNLPNMTITRWECSQCDKQHLEDATIITSKKEWL